MRVATATRDAGRALTRRSSQSATFLTREATRGHAQYDEQASSAGWYFESNSGMIRASICSRRTSLLTLNRASKSLFPSSLASSALRILGSGPEPVAQGRVVDRRSPMSFVGYREDESNLACDRDGSACAQPIMARVPGGRDQLFGCNKPIYELVAPLPLGGTGAAALRAQPASLGKPRVLGRGLVEAKAMAWPQRLANSANKSHFAPGTKPSPARDDGRVSKAKSRACRAKASLFRHPAVSHRQC